MTLVIERLDPPLPLATPTGPGLAHFLFDYGLEHDALWVVADDATGQFWWWPNSRVRARPNVSVGRPDPERPT